MTMDKMFLNSVTPSKKDFPETLDISKLKNARNSQDFIIKMSDDSQSLEDEKSEKWLPEPYGPFSDQKIRKRFIRKVYGILSIQLSFTVILGIVFLSVGEIKSFFQIRPFYALIAMIVAFIPLLMLSCCESMRRSFPINFILLMIFVSYCIMMATSILTFDDQSVLQGFAVASISCVYQTNLVIIAFVVCTAVVLVVTFMSTLPCLDITKCGGLLLALAVAHIFMGLGLFLFFRYNGMGGLKTAHIIYSVMGALIFMLYLAYDTQIILGGRKYELSPEEYIMGAIMLYLDIVNIFLYMLQIMNLTSR